MYLYQPNLHKEYGHQVLQTCINKSKICKKRRGFAYLNGCIRVLGCLGLCLEVNPSEHSVCPLVFRPCDGNNHETLWRSQCCLCYCCLFYLASILVYVAILTAFLTLFYLYRPLHLGRVKESGLQIRYDCLLSAKGQKAQNPSLHSLSCC